MVNAKFEEKELTCRVDHRAYERQGLDLLPTIHEGVAVRQMEAKGITTNKGDFNRWIKKAHKLLRDIRKKITTLTDWIKAAKAELSKPQTPTLVDLLNGYYAARSAGAWSQKAKTGNLKDLAETFNYLMKNQLFTLEDFDAHIQACSDLTEAAKVAMSARKKELAEIQRKYQAEYEHYNSMRDDLMKLLRVKNCVDTVLRQQERPQEKRQEIER